MARPPGYYSGIVRQPRQERQPRVKFPNFTVREWFLIGIVAAICVFVASAAAGIRISSREIEPALLIQLIAKVYLICGISIVGMFLYAVVTKRELKRVNSGLARLALIASFALATGISLAPNATMASAATQEPVSVRCEAKTTTTSTGVVAVIKDWRNTITCLVTIRNIGTSPLEGFVLENSWTTGGIRYKDYVNSPDWKMETTGLETFKLQFNGALRPGDTAQAGVEFQPKCEAGYVEVKSRFAGKEIPVGILLAEPHYGKQSSTQPPHSLSGEIKLPDGSTQPNGVITAQTLCGGQVAQTLVVNGQFQLPRFFVEGQRYIIYGYFYPGDYIHGIVFEPQGRQQDVHVQWNIGGSVEFTK